jgi:hypothetical protein
MRLHGSHLGSWALTCLESRMASRGAAVLDCFTWLLGFPSQGVMWRSYATTCTGLRTVADRLGYKAL